MKKKVIITLFILIIVTIISVLIFINSDSEKRFEAKANSIKNEFLQNELSYISMMGSVMKMNYADDYYINCLGDKVTISVRNMSPFKEPKVNPDILAEIESDLKVLENPPDDIYIEQNRSRVRFIYTIQEYYKGFDCFQIDLTYYDVIPDEYSDRDTTIIENWREVLSDHWVLEIWGME